MTVARKHGSISLLGVRIEETSVADAAMSIEEMIDEGGFHQVATANVNFLVNAQRDPELKRVLTQCDLVVADGMPLVWISRLLGHGVNERVTGVDLIPRLCERAVERGWGIYLLGSDQVHLENSSRVLGERFPGLRIVGMDAPAYAPLAQMDHEGILSRIEAASPHLLLVAFGNPKQELFLAMHRDRLNVPVAIGIGGSFELIGGFLRRAPEWIRNIGMEWAYRVLLEPRRLLGRYVRDGISLAATMPRQLMALLLRRRTYAGLAMETEQHGTAAVVYLSGEMAGDVLLALVGEIEPMLSAQRPVVLDVSRVDSMDAEGVGTLMKLHYLALKHHTPYWVAGLSSAASGILAASRSQANLPIAENVVQALRRIRVGMGRNGELSPEPESGYGARPAGNTVLR